MSADTENKAVEAMGRAMCASPAWPAVFAAGSAATLSRASLLALAETITDEMAERGAMAAGRVWAGWRDLTAKNIDDCRLEAARACFAEMCRAAAGTDREGG